MGKIKIGDLFTLEKGLLQSSKCTPGEYDFITAAKEWKTHNEYSHEEEALIFAAMASGSLGRTHYVNGKFITSDLCYIMTPKNSEKYPINLKFYHFVFNSLREEIVKNTKSGTSKEAINQTNLKNYQIPYFDIEQQHLWIEKLINTKSIKESLVLGIQTQEILLKKLRQSILQEGMEGKLTKEWREQNHDVECTSELLEKIKVKKEQLVKNKKIKKQKLLPPISKDEIPFNIPVTWEWCRFGELIRSATNGLYKKASFYCDTGIPSLRMYNIQNGEIVYSDIRSVNLTDEEFQRYKLKDNDLLINRVNSKELVGKTALIRNKNNNKLVYESMNMRIRLILEQSAEYINKYILTKDVKEYFSNTSKVANGQVSINQGHVFSLITPLPPLEEQKEIVKKIENLFKICDELEEQINSSKTNSQILVQAVLKEAFEK